MEYSMQKLDKSRMEIALSIEGEEWEKHLQAAYRQTRGRYSIQGFRPGKAPYHMVVNRYGKEVLLEDGADIALNAAWKQILQDEKDFEPLGTPNVDIQECSVDGLKANLSVEHYPEVTLGEYKGIKIECPAAEVSKEEVDARLEHEREHAARNVDITDRPLQQGDIATIDFVGSIDGVPFEGGSAQNEPLEIGSNSFIPGFEEQLVGMNPEEERTITVRFPDDYHSESLKGKEAQFDVTLHKIQVRELPELNDEFAKDVSEFDTLEQMRADIEQHLLEEKKEHIRYEQEDKLLKQIAENAQIDLCEYLIEEEMDRREDDLRMRLQQMGLRYADYLAYNNTTEEEYRAQFRDSAIEIVRQRLCIEAIIKAENLTLEEDEIEAEIAKRAQAEGKEPDAFKKGMTQQGMGIMINGLMNEKLFRFLHENNQIDA